MKTCHTFACIALAAACALPAAATVTPKPQRAWEWGTNPAFGIEATLSFGTQDHAFADVITFTLDGSFDLLAHAVTNDAGPLNIRDAMVTPWASNGDEDYLNDELTGGFDVDSNMVQQSFSGIGSGDYLYPIEVAEGSGSPLFAASLAAVPEPQTWALMLAGGGVIGRPARRRRAA